MTISAPRAMNWNARGLLFSNKFFIQMFEVRQINFVFSKMRLERKKFGNHCARPKCFAEVFIGN